MSGLELFPAAINAVRPFLSLALTSAPDRRAAATASGVPVLHSSMNVVPVAAAAEAASANSGVPEILFGTLPIPPKIPCTFTTAFPKSS